MTQWQQQHKKSTFQYSRSYKVLGDGFTEIYDLDFAAYCGAVKRLIPIDMIEYKSEIARKPSKFIFKFQDPEESIPQYAIEFASSESAIHADGVRRYKKSLKTGKLPLLKTNAI
jgi:hypothetical protein